MCALPSLIHPSPPLIRPLPQVQYEANERDEMQRHHFLVNIDNAVPAQCRIYIGECCDSHSPLGVFALLTRMLARMASDDVQTRWVTIRASCAEKEAVAVGECADATSTQGSVVPSHSWVPAT